MNVLEFDDCLRLYDDRNLNPSGYHKITKERINKLYDLLDKIKPIDDDEYKVLYFSVDKGNVKEYYKELKEMGEIENYKKFQEYYLSSYPDSVYWYRLVSSKYKSYRVITIDSKLIINADLNEEIPWEDERLNKLIDFIINRVSQCITLLEEGTYNDYVNKNYSYKNKFGVIKRKDYYELYPEYKKELLEKVSEEEMNYFINNVSDKVSGRLKNMTADKYYEAVKVAYESIGYEVQGLTGKELYLKHADNRDDGLSEIDSSSSSEFDKWFNNKPWSLGHCYEIIPGHSFSNLRLNVVHDDKGYYLSLDGTKILCKEEIAKIYYALSKNNYPVSVFRPETIIEAFKEEDYLGVVPDYVFLVHCEGYFEKYNPKQFIHIKDEKMLEYIMWEDLDSVSLK